MDEVWFKSILQEARKEEEYNIYEKPPFALRNVEIAAVRAVLAGDVEFFEKTAELLRQVLNEESGEG